MISSGEVRKMIDYEEKWRGESDGIRGNPIPRDSSENYLKGYSKAVRESYKGTKLTTLFFISLLTILGMHDRYLEGKRIDKFTGEQKAREERIIQYYQKHGPCSSDATPAYLDFRVQSWMNEVEKDKEKQKWQQKKTWKASQKEM